MDIDRNGLEIMRRDESLRLLGTAVLGRIGITSRALPVVLPVNFRFDGRHVLIRTGIGTKLDAAIDHAVVSFEVDEIDPATETGWSVVITGVAREVTDPRALAAIPSESIARWADGNSADRVVAISVDMVSGRRICGPGTPPAGS